MVWFFGRRSRHGSHEPKDDATSLGRLLVDNGLITSEELKEALYFQHDNGDYMLGQALVAQGSVDKGLVDAMLLVQKAKRSRGDVAEIVDFAAESSKKVSEAHDRFRDTLKRMKTVEEG